MCGICGKINLNNEPVSETLVKRMTSCLSHRGPDDEGIYIKGNVSLGHRRLSIIDLSPLAHQPMSNEDGSIWIVFNGEIYNYRELRAKYCEGIGLRSASDTEVLLHVLAREGERALSELRGMFALALWDRRRERLLLARDQFGKKPLYYAVRGNSFLFASEVKSLLVAPWVSRELDPGAAAKYFLYEYVPAPATGYKEVWQVPMGSFALVTRSSIDVRRWWKPVYRPKRTFRTEQEAAKALDEKLGILHFITGWKK